MLKKSLCCIVVYSTVLTTGNMDSNIELRVHLQNTSNLHNLRAEYFIFYVLISTHKFCFYQPGPVILFGFFFFIKKGYETVCKAVEELKI